MQLDENTKEYEKERPQGLSVIQTGEKSYLEQFFKILPDQENTIEDPKG